jgi:hypothetical protein
VGIILGNERGEVIAAKSKRYEYVSNPFTAEMLVYTDVVLLSCSKG